MNRRSLLHAIAVFAVFALAARLQSVATWVPGYRDLYELYPYYVPEGLRSCAEILLVVLAVVLLRRLSVPGALRNLGLLRRPWRGLLFATAACLPLWAVFALTMPVARGLDPWAVLYLAGLSPLAEEAVFRGFAFGQLRKLGWSFWPAALVPALLFGLLHLRGGEGPLQAGAVFLITAVGGLLFSFVFERWDGSLWAPWGLHALMNLAWNVFAVGDSAFAGWLPTAMQVTTALLAVGLSVWRWRRGGEPMGRGGPSHPG